MLSIFARHENHSHKMHPDLFNFVQHHEHNLNQSSALMHVGGLRISDITLFIV